MSDETEVCVYCKEQKSTFTKEHVVPVSLGGTSKFLRNLVCSDCNRTFGEAFEGKFLKGPGFESLLRSLKGHEGRHGIPVFGDGSYGNRLFAKVHERFPPIQVSLSKNAFRAAIQLVSVSADGKLFHAVFDEDKYEGSTLSLIENLWNRLPPTLGTTKVYLWIRDADVTVSSYRLMRKEFYKYLGLHAIDGDVICDSIEGFPIMLSWETLERQQMYSKICLNTLFWLFPVREFCLNDAFDPIRTFILTGLPEDSKFVRQWDSTSNPIVEMIGLDYVLCVGIFQHKQRIYGIVYFSTIGIFIVDIGPQPELPFGSIVKGLQGMDGDLCLFYSVTNGNELFAVVQRSIALEIRKRMTEDEWFDTVST